MTVDSAAKHNVLMFDSQYAENPRRVFEACRTLINAQSLPWTYSKPKEITDFRLRFEHLPIADGGISISSSTANATYRRTARNIAASMRGGFYATLLLAGKASIENCEQRRVLNAGDLFVCNSLEQITVREHGDVRALGLFFTEDRISQRCPLGVGTISNGSREPLLDCMKFIAREFGSATTEDMVDVFNAVSTLLPRAFRGDASERFQDNPAKRDIRAEIIDFMDTNIGDALLSPAAAASECGISTRYLHALLAEVHITFSLYVIDRRLERAHRDLVSPFFVHVPIAQIAYRWGFRELSTFYRTFKRKFGCTPTQLRACYS